LPSLIRRGGNASTICGCFSIIAWAVGYLTIDHVARRAHLEWPTNLSLFEAATYPAVLDRLLDPQISMALATRVLRSPRSLRPPAPSSTRQRSKAIESTQPEPHAFCSRCLTPILHQRHFESDGYDGLVEADMFICVESCRSTWWRWGGEARTADPSKPGGLVPLSAGDAAAVAKARFLALTARPRCRS
jgi:hypothetical protein